jgi:F-type H+-transporting ATPase subunit alpha
LSDERGGGSLTALPIVETQAQDISAYIPTNLISITDGQVYVSPDLFRKGFLPAVDVGRSVSRVGGKAQLPGYRAVAGDLRLAYSQFEELETFARFATRLDADTRATIEHGRRVREVLKQPEHAPLPVAEQLVLLHATAAGLFDELPPEAVGRLERAVHETVCARHPEVCAHLASGGQPEEADWNKVLESARRVIAGAAESGAG